MREKEREKEGEREKERENVLRVVPHRLLQEMARTSDTGSWSFSAHSCFLSISPPSFLSTLANLSPLSSAITIYYILSMVGLTRAILGCYGSTRTSMHIKPHLSALGRNVHLAAFSSLAPETSLLS